MEIKLIVVGGKNAGHVIPIAVPEFLIGRGPECQLRPNTDRVSRKHCALVVEEGRALVRDFNSTNGTFVNGERISGERELKTGDKLKVGTLEFEVQLTVSVGGKKKTKITNIQEAAARTVQSSADDELDVSDWLSQTETIVSDAGGETHVYKPSYAQGRSAEDDESSSGPAKDAPGREGLFESARAPHKPSSASSRQAADDVLKQMFKRGPEKK